MNMESSIMGQKLKQDIHIGVNIRNIRNAKGMTQEQVVAKLQLLGIDMSRDFYAHIESGVYNIRISELSGFRKVFDVEYNDFFKGI
jgi:transcriptional regulator with XRE-family HTH domain